MIGQLNSNDKKVTVVGAGVSGLLAAYYLDKNGYEVTLLEEQGRSGGLIWTTRTEYGIAESAAHSLLADSKILSLFQELGVEWESLREEGRARYIFRDGKIRRLPLTFLELLQTFWRALRPVPASSSTQPESLTLEEWGLRYLGPAATRYLLTPFVRGIYGADPKNISVSAAFPSLLIPPGKSLLGHFLFKKREKHESRKMIAPRQGMGELTQRLEKRLEERLGARFKKNHAFQALDGHSNLILAVSADRAAQLIAGQKDQGTAQEATPLVQSLANLKYASMVSVTAFVARDAVPERVKGVGVLVPASEKRDCLGILFNSSAFNGRAFDRARWCSFTLMFGGVANPEWVKATDSEIRDAVDRELLAILNISTRPVHLEIHRWNRAIPCYSKEIEILWETARTSWAAQPGNILFGNYTGEVSLRGMIMDAQKLATPGLTSP